MRKYGKYMMKLSTTLHRTNFFLAVSVFVCVSLSLVSVYLYITDGKAPMVIIVSKNKKGERFYAFLFSPSAV